MSRKQGARGDKLPKEGKPAGHRGNGTRSKNRTPVPGGETKRVSSITRRLHLGLVRKKLGISIRLDVLLFLCSVIAYAAGLEIAKTGRISFDGTRSLTRGAAKGSLVYRIMNKAGTSVLVMRVDRVLLIMAGILLAVFVLQLIGILIAYNREDRKIRQILDPLNELALRADELSRISFSEDKYQILEEAITQIRPDDARKLSLGDSELAGVEAAMNNLLIRMKETYQQQARFVNDASHELRTPIAVIQGYANMLDRWGKQDEKILDESILAIQNEADHMNRLVEQLLFLARGDSGRNAVKMEKTDLRELLREVYEESFMIDEKHPYRFRGGSGLPDDTGSAGGDAYEAGGSAGETPIFVTADPGMLKQAVRILTDNAAKYTKEGDEIIFSCGFTGSGEAYIQVQDTGIGMAEADVRHMFERFYRSDEVRSYKGTGLGLSIAKWIVDKHRGHFEILSRTGLGTRIRIVLPAAGEASES